MLTPIIYLRLPLSRCQFFRHREPDYILQHEEPVVFNAYTHEYFIMRNSLINAAKNTHVDMACFSQQQWCNMRTGNNEVQQLNGRKDFAKGLNEDYLCIRLPSEVEMVDTVYHVKPTFTLDTQGVRQLVVSLNNTFKRSLIEWALSTFDFCTSKGKVIARSRSSMLERYLMRYGIENSEAEKDNLRRIIVRWFKTEHINYQSYSCADMQFGDTRDKMTHIDGIQWL